MIAFQRAVRRREIIARVEQIVAHKFKQVAVQIVRAGLGDRADRTPRGPTILRGEAAGLHFEFLQRVREWKRKVQIVKRICMEGPIQVVGHSLPCRTCHRNRDAKIHTPIVVRTHLDGSSG